MKRKLSIAVLLCMVLLSSCSVFKPGCGCPKVSTLNSRQKAMRNS
ncbi:hypothetical protein [Pedobacter sp.]|jgi:hypothetical protein|nr:hypothetical protein [Pedobacter sp.]HWW39548.1 hypothetical protein [Pedobacter sp.]